METISRSGRPVRGFALGDAGYGPLGADPSAGAATALANASGNVACSPPFLTTVMTGAAVGMFTGYALNAPRWASITAGIAAAMFLVPIRVVRPAPQQGV
jgi:hypothetical protein